jgi:lipoprotein-anchoring transpeptidase ErfK/SrfK
MRTYFHHNRSSHPTSNTEIEMNQPAIRNRQRSVLGLLVLSFVAASMLGLNLRASAQDAAIPATSDVAIASARYVAVFDDATTTKVRVRLDANRNFSHRLVFRVISEDGPRYKVQYTARPNGVTGFIDKTGISISKHDYYIVVSLTAHNVIVYKSGKEFLRDVVAVGSKVNPTPTGLYFLSELAKVTTKNSDYGPWAFGVSAFSPKLTKFKGGSGQIGFHGTNKPKDLGKNVSHGCIRTNNATIAKLAAILPQGTPIEIKP